jgi:Flp pilus assembly protein protease CpaA
MEYLCAGIALVMAIVAVAFEVRTNHIPNSVTLPACIAGIVIGVASHSVLPHLAGLFVGLLPALAAWRREILGGGIAKLIGAAGSILGFQLMLVAWLPLLVALGVGWIRYRREGPRPIKGSPFVLAGIGVALTARALGLVPYP